MQSLLANVQPSKLGRRMRSTLDREINCCSEEPSLLGASNPPGAYSAATVPEGGAGGDPGRTGASSKSIEADDSDIKSIYRLKTDYHKKISKASFRQN